MTDRHQRFREWCEEYGGDYQFDDEWDSSYCLLGEAFQDSGGKRHPGETGGLVGLNTDRDITLWTHSDVQMNGNRRKTGNTMAGDEIEFDHHQINLEADGRRVASVSIDGRALL